MKLEDLSKSLFKTAALTGALAIAACQPAPISAPTFQPTPFRTDPPRTTSVPVVINTPAPVVQSTVAPTTPPRATPTNPPTAQPTVNPTVASSGLSIIYSDQPWSIALTGFKRSPNPNRPGWDIVETNFLYTGIHYTVGGVNCSLSKRYMQYFPELTLLWDGGGSANINLNSDNQGGCPEAYRSNHLSGKIDIPQVAQNLKIRCNQAGQIFSPLTPITNDQIQTWFNKMMSGRLFDQTFFTKYKPGDSGVRVSLTGFSKTSGGLSVTIEAENTTTTRDISLSDAYFEYVYALNSLGESVLPYPGTRTSIFSVSSIPPGSKATGRLTITSPRSDARYIVGNLNLFGMDPDLYDVLDLR